METILASWMNNKGGLTYYVIKKGDRGLEMLMLDYGGGQAKGGCVPKNLIKLVKVKNLAT